MFSRSEIKALLMPVIFETLLSYLIGMADTVMVSSAGEAAVSAVSMVDAISLLFIQIFMALGAGGAAVCGQYLGKKNTGMAKKAAGHLAVMLAFVSVIAAVLLLSYQTKLLDFLYGSAEKAVRDNCAVYYHIVMYSVPFIALYNGLAAVFRISGDSRTPLLISIVMNVINIGGNALLVLVFKMGVAGVAIPTLVSRGIACLLIMIMAFRRSFELNIREIFTTRMDASLLRDILRIGGPNGIEGGMFQFGKLILMSLVSTLSTASITANAVGNAVGPLHAFISISVNTVIITVVSRCAGSGDYYQARWYMRYFLKFTIIWQGIVNVFLMLAIPLINRLYGLSSETSLIAAKVMIIHALPGIVLLPLSFQYNTAMRAAGDSEYAMWISSISMWLCRVAGAFLLVKYTNLGVLGVWIAWDIDWIFRICFFIPRYRGHKWEGKVVKG